jgi:hypothetical protein
MKKTKLQVLIAVAALFLSACGAGRGSSVSSGSASGFRSGSRTPRVLTPEAKLALGTLKLEGTSEAVDPTLAAKLLPLWQLLEQLNGSSSTAPQEVAAVLSQIQATMTAEQVGTISAMQLTSADMASVFQQQGQAGGTGSASAGGSRASGSGASASGNRGNAGGTFFFAGGAAPGGGAPGGGFGGGTTGSTRSGTSGGQTGGSVSAAQSAQSAANAISIILVRQVIQLLQARIKS